MLLENIITYDSYSLLNFHLTHKISFIQKLTLQLINKIS